MNSFNDYSVSELLYAVARQLNVAKNAAMIKVKSFALKWMSVSTPLLCTSF